MTVEDFVRGGHAAQAAVDALTPPAPTYQLVTSLSGTITYPGILCVICGKTSYNRHDIEQRYCGFCKRFHQDPREEKSTT